MPGRTWIIVGAIFGALAVGIGAFGAHSLKKTLRATERADVYDPADRYHLTHALPTTNAPLFAL